MFKNTVDETKVHGSFRKSKVYGLVSVMALSAVGAGAVLTAPSVSADEVTNGAVSDASAVSTPVTDAPATVTSTEAPAVTAPAPAVEVAHDNTTPNTATNLVDHQEEAKREDVSIQVETGKKDGAVENEVTSDTLNKAVSDAKGEGVEVKDGSIVRKDNINDARADLAGQENKVNDAKNTQTELNTIQAKTEADAKKAGVDLVNGEKKVYTDNNAEAKEALNKQTTTLNQVTKAQEEVNNKLPNALRVATDAGISVSVDGGKKYRDIKEAMDALAQTLTRLETATKTKQEADASLALAISEAKKKGIHVENTSNVKVSLTGNDYRKAVEDALSTVKNQVSKLETLAQARTRGVEAVERAKAEAEKAGVALELIEGPVAVKDSASAQSAFERNEKAIQEAKQAQESATARIAEVRKQAEALGIKLTDGGLETTTTDNAGKVAEEIVKAVNNKITELKNAQKAVSDANAKNEADYQKALAEYNKAKSQYEKDKAEYDKGVADDKKKQDDYAKAKAEYDKAKAEYDQKLAKYNADYAEYQAKLKAWQATASTFQASQQAYNQAVSAFNSINANNKTSLPNRGDGYTASGSTTHLRDRNLGTYRFVSSGSLRNPSVYITNSAGSVPASRVIKELKWRAGVALEGNGLQAVTGGWENTYDTLSGGTTHRYVATVLEWYKIPNAITMLDGSVHDAYVRAHVDNTGMANQGDNHYMIWNAGEAINTVDGITGDVGTADSIRLMVKVDSPNNNQNYIWVTTLYDLDGGQGLDAPSASTTVLAVGGGMATTSVNPNYIFSHEDLGYDGFGVNTHSLNALDGRNSAPDGTVLIAQIAPEYNTVIRNSPGGRGSLVARADFGGGNAINFNIVPPRLVPETPPTEPEKPKEPTPPKEVPAGNDKTPPKPPVEPQKKPDENQPKAGELAVKGIQVKATVEMPKVVADVPVGVDVNTEAPSIQMQANVDKLGVATTVNPVYVSLQPTNEKTVSNEDGANVNDQLVPKGSVATWGLHNSALKAGRDVVTKYELVDIFPKGFDIDVNRLAELNKENWTFENKGGTWTIALNEQAVTKLNADREKDIEIPRFDAEGIPTNDGATYKNTFKTVITTGSGKVYTVVSNTPVIYTPGSETRTYKGQVIVRYRNMQNEEIRKNVVDVENGDLGSKYDTTDNKPQAITHKGIRYVITPKVDGEETGEVIEGTKYITYYYDVKPLNPAEGMVIVHYEDEDGNPIKNDEVDTPDSPVDTPYDTTDNKPKTIKTNDGVEYELVPVKTKGIEKGKVTEGITEVTYVYKRITPKPETPTPKDNVIKPVKENKDKDGRDIDGKVMLEEGINYYTLLWDLDQYEGLKATNKAINAGFAYFDDYPEDAVTPLEKDFKWVTGDGEEVKGLTLTVVKDFASASPELQAMIEKAGLKDKLKGSFLAWVADSPKEFFDNYVVKGKSLHGYVPMQVNKGFKGIYKNSAYQLDFGNGYYANVVKNEVPNLIPHKDVIVGDESVDGKGVAFGQEFKYQLTGVVMPAGRGEALYEYGYIDNYDENGDEYLNKYKVVATTDIKVRVLTEVKADATYEEDVVLEGGTIVRAGETVKAGSKLVSYKKYAKGSDLTEFTASTHNASEGIVEIFFKEDFLRSITDDSDFGADAFIEMKRIGYGDIENEYPNRVNGRDYKSNKVRTTTPRPEEPTPPANPAEPKRVLPNTGTSAVDASLAVAGMGILALGALGFSVGKKREDEA